jgi:transposase
LRRRSTPPTLFLYDVTSSYLDGQHNPLGEFGYNRDGKRGKLQIAIGLLTDSEGEPLAARVFAGNNSDPVTRWPIRSSWSRSSLGWRSWCS